MLKNKELKYDFKFKVKELQDDENPCITIEGFANTTNKDRSGDVITRNAWEKEGALDNYMKNPVLLAFHDHRRPVGKIVDHEITDEGLKVRAEVYKAADPAVYSMVKAEVLRAFSVGFRLKDARFDEIDETFYITELELMETSLVSVPDNQDSTFSIAKQLGTDNAHLRQICRSNSDKDSLGDDLIMSDKNSPSKDIEAAVAKAVASALSAEKAAEQQAKAAEEAAKAEKNAVIEAAKEAAKEKMTEVSTILSKELSDNLLETVTKKLEEETGSIKEVLEQYGNDLAEQKDKLLAAQRVGTFGEKGSGRDAYSVKGITDEQKDTAVLLAKCLTRKDKTVGIFDTEYGKEIAKAAGFQANDTTTPVPGDHTVDDIDWETEFSDRMYEDLRRVLVVEPLFTTIQMQTNNMRIPTNPEQPYASYVAIDNFKGSDSTPAASVGNRLTEQTLVAHKLSAKDYIGDEELEDSVIALVPIIRQNLIRRMQKSSDRSLLIGVGATAADPIEGLVQHAKDDTNNTVTLGISDGDKLTALTLMQARRGLGEFGLDPQDLVIIVGNDGYYDLLEDGDFRKVDQVGSEMATLVRGQVGQINGTRVVVSGELPAAADGGAAAVIANMRNFWAGSLRGMRVRTDVDIEEEKTIIVASRRFGARKMEANGAAIVQYVA